MKISYAWILLLVSIIAHGFMGRELKSYYDQHVIDTNTIAQLKGDNAMKTTALDFTVEMSRTKAKTDSSKAQLRIDSLTKVKGINPNEVISYNNIETNYVDSVAINAKMEEPIKEPIKEGELQIYEIPFSFDSECSTSEGFIKSTDLNSSVTATKQTVHTINDILVLKPKKFLGFLWRTKKQQIKLFSNCGEVAISGIKYIDQ